MLCACAVARRFGLEPGFDGPAIFRVTNVSKSRAYEVASALAESLPALTRPVGRPPAEKVDPTTATADSEVSRAVLAYVFEHPGCVDRGPGRQRYSDGFRRHVVELRARFADVDMEAFARDTSVPLGTLKDWLSATSAPEPAAGREEGTRVSPGEEVSTSRDAGATSVGDTREMQLVLAAWSRWHGSFGDFCDHMQGELRVPFGRSLLGRLLEVHRVRTPTRRPGRTPDERATRGAFRTFFPGAQWVGDGMQVPIFVDGRRFTFNVELDVDAQSGGLVGASVRDEEDATAVVEAFEDGVRTTGAPPLALLLDNRPSNHTPAVDVALGDTLRIRATLERPQNKGHVEGAFGLFSQVLPPLVFDTSRAPRDAARAFLGVLVDVWARTTNHRPRRDRDGRSRVELYGVTVSDEQIAAAKHELAAIAARQERARLTLEARRNPETLALLDRAFARLALLDPARHIRVAIAGYPLAAIAAGVARFEAKARAGTLPEGVDARYLLGIVRNVSSDLEEQYFAEAFLRIRREVRDLLFERLARERDELRAAAANVSVVVDACVDRALEAPPGLERTFWLETLGDTLRALPDAQKDEACLRASRRIHATFAVPLDERCDAARIVLERATPIV
jgi:hypothetical protein